MRFNGLIILAIALLSLSGHLYGERRLYNWNDAQTAGMGMNTAIEFIGVGISLILISALENDR